MNPIQATVLVFAIALAPMMSFAQNLSDDRIKELALEAIRETPQIIVEAVQLLEQQKAATRATAQADVLKNQRQLLERDPNAPVLENPEGDVTVVEFFDYNCPYCRRAMAEVQGLLAADKNVRLVCREWPILGEGSIFAAKAALAARQQGKYEKFHWALMGLKERAEEASVMRVAKNVGLDVAQLRTDMASAAVQEYIDTSMRLTATFECA